jgi:hypothetical protein
MLREGWWGFGKRYFDVEATFGSVVRGEIGAVGVGDGINDGETESVSAGVGARVTKLLKGPE